MGNETKYVFSNASYTDLTLYQFGGEQCTPLLSCGPAIRNHYLLHYVVSGKGVFETVDGSVHRLSAGQAFIIYPNNISFYCADSKEPWHYIWLEFDGLKAHSLLSEAGISIRTPIYTPLSGAEESLLDHLDYMLAHHDAAPAHLIGRLYLFMDALIRTSASRRPQHQGDLKEFYVREAINYIEQNYSKKIQVSDIAYWCNLNRSYFGKIFKDTVLVTPQEFLLNYRINKACTLMEDLSLPIATVAERVGFDNPLNFSRTFKKMMGVSPREWRKKQVVR